MNTGPPVAERTSVDPLLTAYIRALDVAGTVPAFSFWRYIGFGWQFALWEFAFFALFITPFLDAIRLCLRPLVRGLPSPTGFVWRYFKRPFQAVWQGDISALQLVRVRMLTRAFIGAHVAAAVEQLKLAEDRVRLDCLMRTPLDSGALAVLETDRQKLDSLANVAKAQNSLGTLLATGSASALPLGLAKLLIPAIVQLLPGDVADQIGSYVPLGQLLKSVGLAGDENIMLTPVLLSVGGGFLTFLLITAMSCHIEKRRILAEAGAYAAEDTVLTALHGEKFELPLDVAFGAAAAIAGFATMYIYASLTLTEPDRSDQMQMAITELIVCLCVAAIVAVRRWYLGVSPAGRRGGLHWLLRAMPWYRLANRT